VVLRVHRVNRLVGQTDIAKGLWRQLALSGVHTQIRVLSIKGSRKNNFTLVITCNSMPAMCRAW
jgi:hypothetical protein